MIALAVYVLQCGVRLCVGLVGAVVQVESDVQEADDLFVCFDGDTQSVAVEDSANFLLYVFGVSRRGVSGGQSVVSVESYVDVEALQL